MPGTLMTEGKYPGFFDLDFSTLSPKQLRKACSLEEDTNTAPANWPRIAVPLTRGVMDSLKHFGVTAVRTSDSRPYILEIEVPFNRASEVQARLPACLRQFGLEPESRHANH
jgi:hypothetical protein